MTDDGLDRIGFQVDYLMGLKTNKKIRSKEESKDKIRSVSIPKKKKITPKSKDKEEKLKTKTKNV